MTLVGGREIHPINVRVGGFYRAPTRRELQPLVEPLERAREAALETVRWTAGFDFPERDGRLRARRALAPGRVRDRARPHRLRHAASTSPPREYDEHFEEEHVERSTALHSRLRERGTYLCGPLARFSLNHDRLSPLALEAAREAGLDRRAAIPSAASSSAASSSSTPATRRCA